MVAIKSAVNLEEINEAVYNVLTSDAIEYRIYISEATRAHSLPDFISATTGKLRRALAPTAQMCEAALQ